MREVKLEYYADTDTVYMEFNDNSVVETRDFGDDFIADLDARGNLVALTVEHATQNMPALMMRAMKHTAQESDTAELPFLPGILQEDSDTPRKLSR